MLVLLYYKYVDVPDAQGEAKAHLELCKKLELKGRILISREGLNGTCSGREENIEAYKQYLNTHPLFSGIAFKESEHPEHAFKKLFVRLRPEVVTLRCDADPKKAAPYISPEELHQELQNGDDIVLVDMRNDYEVAIGRFRNAITLPMKNFRDLPSHMPTLEKLKNKKVITYCTGGIRCEKASAFLQAQGFSNVRQLEGGIVKYCEAFPDGYFDGSLFVFDERRSVRFPGKKPPRYVSVCACCRAPCDRHVDCADQACHELFICCERCEQKNSGLCTEHKSLAVSH